MDLTRESFISGRKLEVARVALPAGRGDVYVRELRGDEAAALEEARWIVVEKGSQIVDIPSEDINWTLFCACDSQGAAFFNPKADRQVVASLPACELAEIARVARGLNGSGRQAILDAAKNS
jgi:hypothetical protein